MAELNFGLAKSVEKTIMTLHVPWHGQLCMSLKESIKIIKYTKKNIHKKNSTSCTFLQTGFTIPPLNSARRE